MTAHSLNKLTAQEVKSCAPGKYSDGGGFGFTSAKLAAGSGSCGSPFTGGDGKWGWDLPKM